MLKFKIVTPMGVTYENDIEKVSIPTTMGQITILPKHIPLLSVLKPGELIIYKEGQEIPIAVSGGVVEIKNNNTVYVMADSAERAEHINIERANSARLRAEEFMKQQQFADDVEFARVQAKIEKELARVHVGKKYRKINPSS